MIGTSNNNTPEISIIVAIYNAEKYLYRCIKSLKNQFFTSFEVLLIDDGSTDKSGIICEEVAKKDQRFLVFHKQNEGVSATRQFGVDHAHGIYTIHVDPDDWVEPTYLDALYKQALVSSADIIVCDFFQHEENRNFINRQNIVGMTNNDIIHALLQGKIQGSVGNKLIKRESYNKYGVKFPKGINIWEDLYVCCLFFMYDVVSSYVPQVLYHYDRRQNLFSYTHTLTPIIIEQNTCFVRFFEKKLPNFFYDDLLSRKKLIKWLVIHLANSRKEVIRFFPEINNTYTLFGQSLFCKDWPVWIILHIPGGFILIKLLIRLKRNMQLLFKRFLSLNMKNVNNNKF